MVVGGVTQVVECLRPWVQFSALYEVGTLMPACNPSTALEREMEKDQEFEVSLLFNELQASLGYKRPHPKN